MISEQRREDIAESLRHISGNPPEWATSASLMAELIDVDYPVKWRDSGELFSMLADLVDRGTCRNISEKDGKFESDVFTCSECGNEINVWDSSGGWAEVCYCPFCGRRVVDADD